VNKGIDVHDGSGSVKFRQAGVWLSFMCRKELGADGCREKVEALTKAGFEMKSSGVSNNENLNSDILDGRNLVFQFFINESGKF
jgi:hypothetical protein